MSYIYNAKIIDEKSNKYIRSEITLDISYIVHNDIILMGTHGLEFEVKDPWWNRLLRRLFPKEKSFRKLLKQVRT